MKSLLIATISRKSPAITLHGMLLPLIINLPSYTKVKMYIKETDEISGFVILELYR